MRFSTALTRLNFGRKCRCMNKIQENVLRQTVLYVSSLQPCIWRILFYGNDLFSLESLKVLLTLKEMSVISRLETVNNYKHGNPVREFSLVNGLPTHKWPYKGFNQNDFDLGVVVSFGHLIPEDIINRFPLGMVNVHGSLLPRWRGASPIPYAILHGDHKTGITIMKMKPHRFDIGEVVSQAEITIQPDDTFQTLQHKLSVTGASELAKCINNLPDSLEKAKPQSTVGVTYAPKVTKEMAELNFETMDAKTIFNLDRAVSYFFPLSTNWNNKRVKLRGISPSDFTSTSESPQPGRIYFSNKLKTIFIECQGRTFITFSKIGIPGRTPMSGTDFYNGFLLKMPKEKWFFTL